MLSQQTTNGTIVIFTPNGTYLPQTEKSKPINQGQDNLKKYLKAEVKVLGTIQILCGVMVLSLGTILTSAPFTSFTQVFSSMLLSSYPFLGALCFVISGSLSIITEKKSTKCLVQSSLAANILSSLFALVGFILLSVNLATLGPALRICYSNHENVASEHQTSYYYDFHTNDSGMSCSIINRLLAGMLSMMLICTVLEFCLAVLVAVIWWKQAHSDFPGSVLFQPLSHKNKPDMITKAIFDPEYEELQTPQGENIHQKFDLYESMKIS